MEANKNSLWTYNPGGNGGDEATEFTRKFIAPFGIVQHMEEFVKQEMCQHSYQVLPNDVKEAFPLISKETSTMSVQCTNTGDQRFRTFYWLNCTYRINHFLPTALKTYKSYLPESAKVVDLMFHREEIEVNHKRLLIGKSPNNCKFILRPVDHSKMKHYQMLAQGSSSSASLTRTSLLTFLLQENVLQLLTHQLNHYRVLFQRRTPMY